MLNDELLEAKSADEKSDEPKRNTKESLIDRILSICEEHNLELTVSNTKLKRMSKTALQKLLAELVEDLVKRQMAEAVKAPSPDQNVVALHTLRMLHDMCVIGFEGGLNRYLPPYGYEVDGFSQRLKEPSVSKCIDECLAEIAAEHDVLQYIQSPYARLGLAWTTGLMMSIRRSRPINYQNYNQQLNGITRMGPKPSPQKNTLRPRANRGSPTREVDRSGGPIVKNV
jgi:hypothetical protein